MFADTGLFAEGDVVTLGGGIGGGSPALGPTLGAAAAGVLSCELSAGDVVGLNCEFPIKASWSCCNASGSWGMGLFGFSKMVVKRSTAMTAASRGLRVGNLASSGKNSTVSEMRSLCVFLM